MGREEGELGRRRMEKQSGEGMREGTGTRWEEEDGEEGGKETTQWWLGVATGAWREGSTRAEVGHSREKGVGEKCPKKPDPPIPPSRPNPPKTSCSRLAPRLGHPYSAATPLSGSSGLEWKKKLPSIDWEGLRQMLRGGERGGGSSLAILMYSGW